MSILKTKILNLKVAFHIHYSIIQPDVYYMSHAMARAMRGLRWPKLHWHTFFFEYFRFALSVSFCPCSVAIFILEGHTGETWERSKMQCCFGNRVSLD
jgi:hypothetical protein